MTVGNLTVELSLDRTPAVYNGHEDPVSGRALISFHPSTSQQRELFGPLRLEILLEGTLRTRVFAVHGSSKARYTQERTLFSTTYLLHNGSFRIQAGEKTEFPFTACFPQYADDTTDFNQPTVPNVRRQILPPTFHRRFHRWKARSGEAEVKYEIKAVITIPGIDVNIIYSSSPPTLRFEHAHPHPDELGRSNMIGSRFAINSKALIQPDQRKRRCWSRWYRSLTTLPPKYSFFVRCTSIPENIFVGERLMFEIQVHNNNKKAKGPAVRPMIFLQDCQVDICPSTLLFPGEGRYGCKEIVEDDTRLNVEFDPEIPLSKEDDYASKIILTEPLKEMSSTFKLGRLAHFHRVRIRLVLQIYDKKICFDAARAIRIHAAPLESLLGNEPFEMHVIEELPEYE